MEVSDCFMELAKVWIAAVGVLLTLSTLLKGIIEYTKAQKWKKAEFLAKEIKEFYADVEIQKALKMIDWDYCKIRVTGEDAGKVEIISIKPKKLILALRHHSKDGHFSQDEVQIRHIMDHLFFKLSLFQNYVDTSVVKKVDVKRYLNYYVKIIADKQSDRRDDDFREAIYTFLVSYGYKDVLRLFESFGYQRGN